MPSKALSSICLARLCPCYLDKYPQTPLRWRYKARTEQVEKLKRKRSESESTEWMLSSDNVGIEASTVRGPG